MLRRDSIPPSARIERWRLHLQQFDYKVTHIPGKKNAADALSRFPVGKSDDGDMRATEEYAYSAAVEAVPAALRPSDVERASEQDATLKMVREAVEKGDWTKL